MSTERPLVIITSGAYAEPELAAEFGELPSSFLPLGLGRLYDIQAKLFDALDADIVLTLPESYRLAMWDHRRLEELQLTVHRTADGMTLGAALMHALGAVGFSSRKLRILHGDTLVSGVDVHRDDVFAVAPGRDGYRWAYVEGDDAGVVTNVFSNRLTEAPPNSMRLCGYMAFASVADYAEALAVSNCNFIDSLSRMASVTPIAMVQPGEWLDFGHVQTFFRSRRIATTQRAFNSLEMSATSVRKRSPSKPDKIKAEARWLKEAPLPLAPYAVRVLADGEDEAGYFYDTEYEYIPTLSELYIFGNLSLGSWDTILRSCARFIDASVASAPAVHGADVFQDLVIAKTIARLESFCQSADLDIDAPNRLNGQPAPSLRTCLDGVIKAVQGAPRHFSVMHGDFCFSNIMYNFKTERIRVIDPRAIGEDGAYTPFGDCRYDLAKLMHSIVGYYDMIIANRYFGRRAGKQDFDLEFTLYPWRRELEGHVANLTMGGVKLDDDAVWAGMVSLFLSMPPLHFDRPDRQMAFMANALRLYTLRD